MVNRGLVKPCNLDFLIILYYSFHFFRGHQELSVNTLHAIFEEIMSMW